MTDATNGNDFGRSRLYYAHGRRYSANLGRFISPNAKGDYMYGGDDAVNFAWFTRGGRRGGLGAPPQLNNPNCDVVALNCTVEDFAKLDIQTRERWMHDFQSVQQTQRWFNTVEGILQFIDEKGLVWPNSYVSWVDASILNAIQDGKGLRKGFIQQSSNPGGRLWQKFFADLNDGRDYVNLRQDWGNAEQTSTDYGRRLAQQHNASYGSWGNAWAASITIDVFGDVYRNVNKIPYGGGLIAGGAGIYFGSVTCGLASIVCAPIYGYLGFNVGEWFEDPRSEGATYYAANEIYYRVYTLYDIGFVLDALYGLQPK